jgi:serine/threonine protein kinase
MLRGNHRNTLCDAKRSCVPKSSEWGLAVKRPENDRLKWQHQALQHEADAYKVLQASTPGRSAPGFPRFFEIINDLKRVPNCILEHIKAPPYYFYWLVVEGRKSAEGGPRGWFREDLVFQCMQELLKAVQYMHSKGVLHRDYLWRAVLAHKVCRQGCWRGRRG